MSKVFFAFIYITFLQLHVEGSITVWEVGNVVVGNEIPVFMISVFVFGIEN